MRVEGAEEKDELSGHFQVTLANRVLQRSFPPVHVAGKHLVEKSAWERERGEK